MLLLWSVYFFSKLTFSKNPFSNTIRVSNGLDPDQDRHSVGPDLGPNFLQSLSADDKLLLARQELCFSIISCLVRTVLATRFPGIHLKIVTYMKSASGSCFFSKVKCLV